MGATRWPSFTIALLLFGLVLAAGAKDKDKETKTLYTGKESWVTHLNAKTLKTEVLKSNRLWVVEFYADWCGGCKKFKPKYKELAEDLADVVSFGAINIDKNDTLVKNYGVRGLPAMRIFGLDKKKTPFELDISTKTKQYKNQRALTRDIVIHFPDNLIFQVNKKNVEKFFADDAFNYKVMLFTTKDETPALYKAISFENNDRAKFGEINVDGNEDVAKMFGISDYPKLVIIANRGTADEKIDIYEGPIKAGLVREWVDKVFPTKEVQQEYKKKVKAQKEAKQDELRAAQQEKMAEKEAEVKEKQAQELDKKMKTVRPLTLEVARKSQIRGRKSYFNQCAGSAKGFCALIVYPSEPTDEQLLEMVDLHRKWNAGGGMQDYPYKFSWIDAEDIPEAPDTFGVELFNTGDKRDVVIIGTQEEQEARYSLVQMDSDGVKYHGDQPMLQFTFFEDDLW
eukprot:CAMPEP_0197865070 /NCGR_PEP_ID=MMETSP1438-20131217/43453_1 /TAXON_ID=1461541 /ORGANISM="Pterosperma sp., Strain CCMP1384" /LENGTH=453 /DNA_ID=CAMNT_0043483479 /DNA_START=74 /DNA_END=1435 /DNA_ORIENTATION=-